MKNKNSLRALIHICKFIYYPKIDLRDIKQKYSKQILNAYIYIFFSKKKLNVYIFIFFFSKKKNFIYVYIIYIFFYLFCTDME